MRQLLSSVLFVLPAVAQSNAVPGLDVRVYEMGDASVYGRRGAAYPGGEVGLNLGHSMANCGTALIPWTGGTFGGLMLETYPKIASLLARESSGRMVQVSGKSFCKHSRVAFNFSGGGPCAPCTSGPSNTWRPGCYDIYSSGFSNLNSLGPTTEIDPWLGTWNPVGSYFDRGDPPVSGPQANDGIMSPISSSDPIYNRMIVQERELATPGTFWGQTHLVVIGEPGTNRGDNQVSRQAAFSWNGSSWTGSVSGAAFPGPVLTRWSGASTATARNGNDDGHFMVGWKVTGPVDGFWHYELAIHNIDNAAGGAAIRLPVCATARVRNAGFRDIDTNVLNEWTFSRTGNEIAWLAAANNPLDWNTIYNVWFDCDAAPVAGNISIDRARIGPGALSVVVAAQVPGRLGQEYTGAGCGTPAPTLAANGLPTIPNASYALTLQGAANAPSLLALSLGGDNASLGAGCTRYIDPVLATASSLMTADVLGRATWNLPIGPALLAMDIWCQGAQIVNGGPLFGQMTLTNGLRVRIGAAGCQ
jgi:hypothetical protein